MSRRVQAEQPGERHTDQQLPADVDQAKDRSRPTMRQGVDWTTFGHLLENLRRQTEPLTVDTEQKYGSPRAGPLMVGVGEMPSPFTAVIRRQRPVQQMPGSMSIHWAVARMNASGLLLACAGAINSDVAPAFGGYSRGRILDRFRLGPVRQRMDHEPGVR